MKKRNSNCRQMCFYKHDQIITKLEKIRTPLKSIKLLARITQAQFNEQVLVVGQQLKQRHIKVPAELSSLHSGVNGKIIKRFISKT